MFSLFGHEQVRLSHPLRELQVENPPYGILEGVMETTASFEARSAP